MLRCGIRTQALPAMPLICDSTRESFRRPTPKHPLLHALWPGRVAHPPHQHQHHSDSDVRAASSASEAKYTCCCSPTPSSQLLVPSRSLCYLSTYLPPVLFTYKHKSKEYGHRLQQRPCLCAARRRARSSPPVQWHRQSQQLVATRPSSLRLPQYAFLA
jgi:hypothetical protein